MKEVQIKEIGPRLIEIKTERVCKTVGPGQTVIYYKPLESETEALKKDVNKVIEALEEDMNIETARVGFITRTGIKENGFTATYTMEITLKEPALA